MVIFGRRVEVLQSGNINYTDHDHGVYLTVEPRTVKLFWKVGSFYRNWRTNEMTKPTFIEYSVN